jgi:hypothetical protein
MDQRRRKEGFGFVAEQNTPVFTHLLPPAPTFVSQLSARDSLQSPSSVISAAVGQITSTDPSGM